MLGRIGRGAGWLAAVAAVCGLLAGCSSSKGAESAAADGAAKAPAAAMGNNNAPAPGAGGAAAASGSGSGTSGGGSGSAPGSSKNPLTTVTPAGRDLVFTADLTVRTKDVAAATRHAESVAAAEKGFVGTEKDTSGATADAAQATVTLRVPSASFDDTISQLGTDGNVEQENRSTDDVTGQVADVGSRIKSAQASIDRLNELMKSTTGLTDIVSLENDLTQRESDLEALEAKQAALADQVTLSTVTVTYLAPVAKPAPVETPVVKKKERNAFVRGLSAGWHALVAVVKVLLIVLGVLLPFLVPGLLLGWLVWRLYLRRARALRQAAPVPAAPAPSAADQRDSGDLSNASAAATADGSK